MKKINVYFRPVTENQDISNMYVADDAFTVRLEAQKQLKQERQQEIEDRLKARKDAAEETRRDGAVKKTVVQMVDEAIDSVVNCLDAPFASTKRILHSRPSNWEIIADEANIYGNYSTIRTYQEVFSDATSLASNKRLSRWKKDLKVGKQPNMNKFHLAYSKEIDKELFDTALARGNEGCLSVDNSLLRQLLLVILAKNG